MKYNNKRTLLTRDDFRNLVFKRDGNKCVHCGGIAQDAHHIMERRLFSDGGYYLNNGVSLCGDCHIMAENTKISPDDLRNKIGITEPILPDDFGENAKYDKWGNEYLKNGLRMKGPLFYDESVQKVLKSGGFTESDFSDFVKYPRTLHLPFSPGATSDDKMLDNCEHFKGKDIVITVKMDGENCNMYKNHIHARSLEFISGEDASHAKTIWNRIKYEIPDGWRICCENLAAKHSIEYKNLQDWIYVFSIWNEKNYCLSWEETVEWCDLLELTHVSIVYDGKFDDANFNEISERVLSQGQEGFVVRIKEPFHFSDFSRSFAKFVRANHVQTNDHWKYSKREWNSISITQDTEKWLESST